VSTSCVSRPVAGLFVFSPQNEGLAPISTEPQFLGLPGFNRSM